MVVPLAVNSQSLRDASLAVAPIRNVTVCPMVSDICDANVRCQINR